MKLKYLNPNVVFVMSGQSGGSPAGSEDASLTVQLLDSVSGQLLYRQTLEVTPNHIVSRAAMPIVKHYGLRIFNYSELQRTPANTKLRRCNLI